MRVLRARPLVSGVWTLQTASCCTRLDEVPQLTGKVYLPNTAAYEQRLDTYYSANTALSPWCMVMPNSTEDVSKIVKVLAANGCPFGIRSGAHSAYKGANSVEDGVTIDFSYMKRTVYDSKNRIARIEPGSNWGLVYEALDPYGVAAVGGRAFPVGVGGFTTGGWAILSNSDAIESPSSFSKLFSIPSTFNTTAKGKVADVVPQFTGPTPLGLYANWMTGTTTNDIRIMTFMHDKLDEYVDKMRASAPDSKFSVLVQFQPVAQSMVEHSRENGGNVLGLESVVAKGPALMWLIAVTVDIEQNQQKIDQFTRAFKENVNAYAAEMGIGYPWVYLNYARGGQDPLLHYGDDNVELIKKASKKYDPDGIFQNLRRSGFKIPV
ncbi:hypothetical protein NW752_000107 [Fusarium irregulare]|nr:hypothetical protein NW752_000107 [Fusarium irregulare]